MRRWEFISNCPQHRRGMAARGGWAAATEAADPRLRHRPAREAIAMRVGTHLSTNGWAGSAVRTATWLGLSLIACIAQPAVAADRAANVDDARIAAADRDPTNWVTYGRTYSEQRFSPLSRITADNADRLGLAWYADL